MGLFNRSARQRQQSAFAAFVFGCLMSIGAFPMLFLNEGRAVKTARALKEGAAAVVSIDANHVDEDNDGAFIHLTGTAKTSEILNDGQFGVEANAIRLVRKVEMYQWKEYEEEVKRTDSNGKTTTETSYGYEKEWSKDPIDSGKFNDPVNHPNPAALPFESMTYDAKEVYVGEYLLPHGMTSRIDQPQPVIVDLAKVDPALSESVTPASGTTSSANGFYWSVTGESTPAEPQIGDARIHFTVTNATDVSLMAQQTGNTLKPFQAHSGRKLSMVSLGIFTADEMIDKAEAENTAVTWMLRFVGTALLVFGIGLLFQPLTSMFSWIPILGNLVGMGTTVVAMLLGGGLALTTIGVAWLFYRPLLASVLIGIGVAMLWLLMRQSKSNDAPVAAQVLPESL